MLICGGLIWAVDRKENTGIAGWETLNVSMEQAIGSDPEASKNIAGVNQKSAVATGESLNKGNSVTVPSDEKEKGDESSAPVAATNVTATAKPITVEPVEPVVQDGKVNVNTASNKDLMDLPGIGEKKAQAIIDYRSSVGAFHSLSDLGKVKGIGTKMLEKLKPLVVF